MIRYPAYRGTVTDSTGRSVSFTKTGDVLTNVTGLGNAQWQYSYDSLYRMLTVINPASVIISVTKWKRPIRRKA